MPATVTVGCRIPSGLQLRLFDFVDNRIPLPGGGFVVEKIARARGQTYRVNGYAKPWGQDLGVHVVPAAKGGGGYAITEGIPEDFWEEWLIQNAQADYVLNGMIFAQDKRADVIAEAKDRAGSWDGLQPLEQGKDPRNPKRLLPDGKQVDAIEQRDRKDE